MITFSVALALLVLGYFIYGAFVEKVFGADPKRVTPAYSKQDDIDYKPMASWKVFLIQFLNIAGNGPIFGAIMGVLFGPAAYLWIVLGCIFGGAVHDYLAGMISLRKDGASLPEVIGDELGNSGRLSMRFLSLLLMIMVGAVFVTAPAGLLDKLLSCRFYFADGSIFFNPDKDVLAQIGDAAYSISAWPVIIFAYYILATLLPIDALIGRVYPLFGVALIFMALGVLYGIFTQPGNMPEAGQMFTNCHPKQVPIFPMLCISIACGAVSGFHATQSPMMARCLKSEKLGRPVFYGAMITEGIVALIWAAAAVKFADTLNIAGNTPYEKLMNFIAKEGDAGAVVKAVCNSWLGSTGAVLAILGVVAAPITSGDTALRAARLIAADFLHFGQKTIKSRLVIAIPLFVLVAVVMNLNFGVLWRYFAWLNQSLSIFTFWAITLWLFKNNKQYIITLIPALWMTCVCTTFIFISPTEGFAAFFPDSAVTDSSNMVAAIVRVWPLVSYGVGFLVTLVCFLAFLRFTRSYSNNSKQL